MKNDEKCVRLEKAVRENMRLNALRNDLDAYLYAWCEYALGEAGSPPVPEDYGVPPPDWE